MSNVDSRKRSAFAANPGYRVDFEPCAKRIRVLFNGQTLADTTAVHLLRETKHVPVYYFPKTDVRLDLLRPSDHRTFCPFKGDASYWHVVDGDRTAENAVWSYQEPFEEVAPIKDYLAFIWGQMDAWYEEDEEVFVHARDPHVRIDVLGSNRPLEVILGGEVIASTTKACFLFETGLPVRYYIPPEDVRRDLLDPSESRSACPYKGTAGYFSAKVGGQSYENIVWSYPDPLPEVAGIKGLLCFFNEKVDAIRLDGQELPRPRTKWS